MEGIKRVSERKRDRTRKSMIRGRVIEEKRREERKLQRNTESWREGGREGGKEGRIEE